MQAYEKLLMDLLHSSLDGYALFGPDDRLVYANDAFLSLMYVFRDEVGRLTFDAILRRNFHQGRAAHIGSGDIEQFIAYVESVRRSKPYRLFEVDYLDGRWFLMSEQTDAMGNMLLQIKDITKQKQSEQHLQAALYKYHVMALTDELTGVANRRAIQDSVSAELARCSRIGAAMTILLVDLDHFKRVNDTYGHHIGDLALKHCAEVMKASLRPFDMIGRLGGEEFVVFLGNTDSQDARVIAERIRAQIQSLPLQTPGREIALSVSIGVSTQHHNPTFESLYLEADQALYEAKSQGRNRVTLS
ncbi:GGDEF domain-containing protein [Shewanella sedimentimangrovi]|uniref:diguanylate cyclase n=1 Tax=Shewanella sedimentimangrovi TaxID=2814293 RepID=A0ABX7R203_9GAMM|nr:sensor domain-containing diguanylate cyclase [Shewanella sedimentimangrovi]QSX37846.1 diguanylate cyclase [Shewanella sedimentimangrovi]